MEEPSPAGPAESLDEIPGNVEKKMYLQNISEYCIQIRYSERDDLGEFDEESQVEFKIVLTRSGEYECIQERAFGSWFDTTLTTKGHADILVASKALKMGQYEFDLAFCSVLKRCKESLKLILNHLELDDIEIHECWELNERHYGALTGCNEFELCAQYGYEQIQYWCYSYKHAPPPLTKQHKLYDSISNMECYKKIPNLPKTESPQMLQKRIVKFWNKVICPNILCGRKILVVTHNEVIQALVQYLDDLEYSDFRDAEISRVTPFFYELDETLKPVLNL